MLHIPLPTQLCFKCHNNADTTFLIYFAKTIKKETTQIGNTTHYTNTFHVGGSTQIPVCHDCIIREGNKSQKKSLVGGLIAIVLALAVIAGIVWVYNTSGNLSLILILFGVAGLLSVPGIITLTSTMKYFYSNQGYQLKVIHEKMSDVEHEFVTSLIRDDFSKQGFDVLMSSETYERMKISSAF